MKSCKQGIDSLLNIRAKGKEGKEFYKCQRDTTIVMTVTMTVAAGTTDVAQNQTMIAQVGSLVVPVPTSIMVQILVAPLSQTTVAPGQIMVVPMENDLGVATDQAAVSEVRKDMGAVAASMGAAAVKVIGAAAGKTRATVTLTGTVPTRNDQRRAEDIAEGVSGVSNVENRLRVKQSTPSYLGTGMTGTGLETRTDTSTTGYNTGTSSSAGTSFESGTPGTTTSAAAAGGGSTGTRGGRNTGD